MIKPLNSIAAAGDALGQTRYIIKQWMDSGDLEVITIAGKDWIKGTSIVSLGQRLGLDLKLDAS